MLLQSRFKLWWAPYILIPKNVFQLNEDADFDEAHSLQPFVKRGGFDYQLPQGEFFFCDFIFLMERSNGIMQAIRLRIKIRFE